MAHAHGHTTRKSGSGATRGRSPAAAKGNKSRGGGKEDPKKRGRTAK